MQLKSGVFKGKKSQGKGVEDKLEDKNHKQGKGWRTNYARSGEVENEEIRQ